MLALWWKFMSVKWKQKLQNLSPVSFIDARYDWLNFLLYFDHVKANYEQLILKDAALN